MPKRLTEKNKPTTLNTNTTDSHLTEIALIHIDRHFVVNYANPKAVQVWNLGKGTLITKGFAKACGTWSSKQRAWLRTCIRQQQWTPADLQDNNGRLQAYISEGDCLLLYVFAVTPPAGIQEAGNDHKNRVAYLEKKVNALRQDLLQLEQQHQQEIIKTIVATQEQERLRIAENLHTEIGQLLSVLQMQLDHLPLKEIKKMLKETILKVRQVSFELMPSVLKDFGLEKALRDLIGKSLTERDIRCNLVFSMGAVQLDDEAQLMLFRIIQELINNVVRHSKATRVSVSLKDTADGIRLTVQDNGTGADLKALKKGFGLSSIESRVKTMKGWFLLTSPAKTGGTKAEVLFPMTSADQAVDQRIADQS